MGTNDVTGDRLTSKVSRNNKFAENYDSIFRKPKQLDLFDEERIDIVGQNGNTGEHYEETDAD